MNLRRLALLVALALAPAAAAQTYIVSNAPIEFPVNTPGATFTMTGIFPAPNFSNNGTQYGVCFYTGVGASSTPIVPTNETYIGNDNYTATVTVPASSFQVTTGFGADGINRSGKFYIAPAGSTCTGDYNTSLTSENALLIALPPTLTSVAASSIEQPNTNLQSVFPNVAPPHRLTFTGNYFYGPYNGGPASVVFNWSSSSTSTATQSALVVPTQNSLVALVPALPSDVSNLTAQVCNPVGTYTSCSAALSIAVNALIPSSGTVNSSASPATLGTQVNLTAEFSPAGPSGPGSSNPMPTGMVTFTSDNTGSVVTIGTAPLVLDPTTSLFANASFNQFTVTGAYPALPTVTADLNKDGLADIVLYSNTFTNPSTQAVTPAQFTILLGNMPFGTFQTPTTLALPTNCASVTSYALGDLNTDGFSDLVLACVPLSPTTNDPYETYVMLGNGDGTFQSPYQITGVTGSLLALADMNGDGYLDLVSQGPIFGQSNSYGFVVLQGDGQGDLYAPGTSGYPGATTSTGYFVPGSQFLVVDLNKDGRPDIAELDNNGPHGNTIDVYQNHSNGSGFYFGGAPQNGGIQPDTYFQLGGYPKAYISLFAGDLNKDGLPELGAAQTYNTGNSNPYSIDYAFNTSTGGAISFGSLQSVGLGNAPTYVAAADFTGDGFPDLVVGSSNTQVYDNDGTGQFVIDQHLTSSTYPTPLIIAAVDLNGDSVTDLILGVATYPNNGSTYTVAGEITSGSAIATLPYTFTTGSNANITANWPGSASVAAPTTAPTLSLPLTGSGGGSSTPTYSITNSSPSYLSVGAGDTYIIIAGNPLPTFGSGSYGVCFYTGYGASSTLIIPANNSTNASFTIPASSIQQIPASAYSNGSFSAQIYVAAAGSTCNGTPDPTLTNTYGLNIASNQATINSFQVPFVPALNQALAGEGGPPTFPSNLIGTGTNFLGTGYINSGSSSPMTTLTPYTDGNSAYIYYGDIFSSTSFATSNPVSYPFPSSTVGVQACDNIGSPCSNLYTVPVNPLETDNGTASFQVLNANTDSFTIPPSGTHQAAAPGFYSDTTAANYSNLTNVSPGTPASTGHYSVSATGLYTFYSGDIGSQISITYDTTTSSTTPTTNNPVVLKATFGTPTPDVTGAPSGAVNFFDNTTYTSYYNALTLDPTATWVAGAGGGNDNAFATSTLQPTVLDFNNDSIPDILVVDDGSRSGLPSLQLMAGSLPSGTYTSPNPFYVQDVLPNCATIASYAVADFNGDGTPDVAVLCTPVGNGNNNLSVILNNGDGTFNTTPLTWRSSINGSQIVAGDFNGDGNQDIVYSGVVNSYNGNNTIGFQVLDGDGTGNFTLPDFYTRVPLAVGTQLAAADFDGDGYTDLAVLNGDPNNPNIAVYQNTGAQAGNTGIQFTTPPVTIAIPSAASVGSFSIVTLGAGQLPSIVFPVSGSASPGVYAAPTNSVSGNVAFAPTVITPVANLANAVFGDINGDGNLDAVVDNGTNITVLTSDGYGDFTGTAFTALTLSDNGNALIAAVDLNDDGYADLLTYGSPIQSGARPGNGVSNHLSRGTLQPHLGFGSQLNSYITAGTASAVTQPATFSNGQHTIQATANGTVQIASGSATTSFNVASYTDSLAVTTSGTPSSYGQTVQIYATLTAQPTGGPAPTGNVTFYDGSTQIGSSYALNAGGVATFPYSGLGVGSHNLTAQYPGDSNYPAATSPIFVQSVGQITPILKWAPPSAITYGTALGNTQLNATATDGNGNTIPGTFNYTPGAGTVLAAGNQPLSVTFIPSDTTTYSSPTLGNSIVVNKFTPSLTWSPAVTTFTYGTPLSTAQLDPVAKDINGNPISGAFTYVYARSAPTVASGAAAVGTILSAGSYSITGTFTPTDTTDYNTGTPITYIGFTVNQATPIITWAPPAAITFGTALSNTQLNATAKDSSGNTILGTFAYMPQAGTTLPAGNQSLSVLFTPNDTTDYASRTVGNSIQVNKATPVITWNPPAAITYGTALSTTQLNASAPVSGTYTYNPIAGTILNAGNQTLSVGFVPTDTADYNSVPVTTTSILVNKATPGITWNPPAAITYGTPLSLTQLNATSPVAGTFTYNPIAGTILNAGNQTLSVGFVPTDTADYNSVPVTTTSLLVNKANPILNYNPTPLALTYGTALSASQLGATSSDPTGTFAYTYNGTSSGTTSPGTVLGVGSYLLKATFTPTDTNYNAASINGGTLVISQATPVLTWATPADIIAGVPLSTTQLNATVGGNIPGGFTYTPAAGTVLSAGNGQTLNVKFTPSDLVDYTTASNSTTINVIPLVIGNVTPGTATLGDPAKPITLTGTGFLANSVVQANGTALPTAYVNATTLTATIPASNFLTLSPIAITVLDPTQALSTSAFSMPIAAAVPATTFTGPSTVPPGQQPTLNFNMTAAYPVPLTATVTLTFAGTGGVDDPAIQFAAGTRTFTFTIPAGSTTVPTLQFQDGTDAGTITATLVLTALGTTVTPATIQPINVTIPPAPPEITTATLTRSGNTLTVFIVGYSNTRDMTTAQFHFNAANGATINDPDITIQAPALFTPWFSQTASQAYGSNFGYTQTFNLSTDASSVGSVTITLTNSVGNSITVTAQ
jgi:hypothetical protein